MDVLGLFNRLDRRKKNLRGVREYNLEIRKKVKRSLKTSAFKKALGTSRN